MSTTQTAADYRTIIRNRILESEKPQPKILQMGSPHLDFTDFMHIMLYVISLQPDIADITDIRSIYFWRIVQGVWREQFLKLKEELGYRYTTIHRRERRFIAHDLDRAWADGVGDTMGVAESFASLYPGFYRHKYLGTFYALPKKIARREEKPAWVIWKGAIERGTFARMKQNVNFRKLDSIFDFADAVCERLREYKREQN